MKKVFGYFRKEMMLTLSLLAAVVALIITPPSERLLRDIDWRTLGTLLMMLCVLEGFKKENIFRPLIRLAARMKRMTTLTLFLVFGVFFTSMFVTNDVSLIIFVPLTILLFGAAGKEKYILPVLTFQNIAAIRGSLLMPFGSPQNLFLYGQASVSAWHFMLHMLPLCVMSAALLIGFIFFLYRKDPREAIDAGTVDKPWTPEGTGRLSRRRPVATTQVAGTSGATAAFSLRQTSVCARWTAPRTHSSWGQTAVRPMRTDAGRTPIGAWASNRRAPRQAWWGSRSRTGGRAATGRTATVIAGTAAGFPRIRCMKPS